MVIGDGSRRTLHDGDLKNRLPVRSTVEHASRLLLILPRPILSAPAKQQKCRQHNPHRAQISASARHTFSEINFHLELLRWSAEHFVVCSRCELAEAVRCGFLVDSRHTHSSRWCLSRP